MTRLTSPLAALRRLLARSQRPIYALDEERTLVFANDALALWAETPLDALLGVRCDYGVGDTPARGAAAGLCPPPDMLQSTTGRLIARAVTAEGQWKRRRGSMVAWRQDDQLEAVVVVLDDHDLSADDEEQEPDTAQLLHQQVAQLRSLLPTHATFHLLGDSALMRRVRQQVDAASATEASVLVTGPRGVGREAVAKSIYYGGVSSRGMLPLACPLLDTELLANALEDLRRSRWELAEGPDAILLLDVDQLPTPAQSALYDRLTRLDPAPRLLATSRVPLSSEPPSEPHGESFHAELALLLSGIVIELPPLVERRADVPLLAQLIVQDHNARGGMQLSGFEPDALDMLLLYPWFENHDELRRLVLEACRAARGPRIRRADLPEPLRLAMQQAAHPPRVAQPIDLPAFLEQVERELIQRALEQAKGNKTQAARLLGLQRSRLLRRLEALGLGDASGKPAAPTRSPERPEPGPERQTGEPLMATDARELEELEPLEEAIFEFEEDDSPDP